MDQSDLAIKLAFKNNLILKILAISANLNDILDELGTILDDPYVIVIVLNMIIDSIKINYIV